MRSAHTGTILVFALFAACGDAGTTSRAPASGGSGGSYGTGGSTYAPPSTTGGGGSTYVPPAVTGGTTYVPPAATGGSSGGTYVPPIAAGAGGTAGGAGAAPVGTAAGSIALTGGYYDNGAYHGYLYTAAGTGSTISPPCGSGACFTTQACVTGTVSKVSSATAYSDEWGVLVGWNLAQAPAPPNPAETADITGKTIHVSLSTGSTPLPTGMRVKVTSGGVEYCTDLTDATAAIPAASLRKECWTAGGDALPASAPVGAVAVQVVSDGSTDKPFDFCISALSVE
jgi:hypothetical protein